MSDDLLQPVPPAPLQLTINTSNVALGIIALVLGVASLRLAREVLIPITLSIMLTYALMPAVTWLQRKLRLQLAVAAAVVLSLVIGVMAGGTYALQPQMMKLLDSLPEATQHFEKLLHRNSLDRSSAINKASAAAVALEKAANTAVNSKPATAAPSDASIELRAYLWLGTAATLRGLWQLTVIIALVYFLLISSHSFKRKLVKLSGYTFKQKKVTVQILDEIDSQIQRYLAIQIVTSALVGLLTGGVFMLLGVSNAALWGVAAGVLHLIPYIGPAVIVAASSLFAYLQFEQLQPVLLVAGSALAIAGSIGLMLVPWLTDKIGRINVVATFVTLLFWDWLWGIPGLLLGIPIMMTVMAVCERFENLVPVAELLGSHQERRSLRLKTGSATEMDQPAEAG